MTSDECSSGPVVHIQVQKLVTSVKSTDTVGRHSIICLFQMKYTDDSDFLVPWTLAGTTYSSGGYYSLWQPCVHFILTHLSDSVLRCFNFNATASSFSFANKFHNWVICSEWSQHHPVSSVQLLVTFEVWMVASTFWVDRPILLMKWDISLAGFSVTCILVECSIKLVKNPELTD